MSNLAVKIINVSLSAELIGTHPRETYIYTYTHGQGHVDYQHRSVMLNCSKLLTINTMSKLKKKVVLRVGLNLSHTSKSPGTF